MKRLLNLGLLGLFAAAALVALPSVAAADAPLISAGYFHACGVTSDGAALCWGRDDQGQLGNGAGGDSPVATAVEGLDSGVTAIASGYSFSCAIKSGDVYCWGDDSKGQVGNGAGGDAATPYKTITGGATHISAGDESACAVVSGGVQCWGRNSGGALGTGDETDSPLPIQVPSLPSGSGVTKVEINSSHACAVVAGAAKCWGLNGGGRLGNGSTTQSYTPVDVTGLTSGVTDISVGLSFSCAVASGAAKCWGGEPFQELGNGTSGGSTTPVDVTGLSSGVTSISAFQYHVCAVASGAAKCWGSDGNGQLGNGLPKSTENVPVQVTGLTSGVDAVSAGPYHSCARVGSAAWCWGQGLYGKLGNDGVDDQPAPVRVLNFGPPDPPAGGGGGTDLTPALPQILSAPKKVAVGKKITLKLSCATACSLALTLKIGKKTVKGLKALTPAAGVSSYSFKLPSKPAKQVKAALKKSKKTKVVLSITPRSAQGAGSAKQIKISL